MAFPSLRSQMNQENAEPYRPIGKESDSDAKPAEVRPSNPPGEYSLRADVHGLCCAFVAFAAKHNVVGNNPDRDVMYPNRGSGNQGMKPDAFAASTRNGFLHVCGNWKYPKVDTLKIGVINADVMGGAASSIGNGDGVRVNE
jgi:hypothetical protein